jgi:hypothetical protein
MYYNIKGGEFMSERIFNSEIMNHDYGYKTTWIYKTDISTMSGGGEQRRARWEKPLRRYMLPFNNKTIPNLQTLLAFFHDHKGAYEAFYFWDNDCRLNWTVLDGYKNISGGNLNYILLEWRPISLTLPLSLSNVPNLTTDVVVKVNGTHRTANLTLDAVNQKITFSGTKPLSTDVITVAYSYLTRVRFATDIAELNGTFYNLGNSTIELQEVR